MGLISRQYGYGYYNDGCTVNSQGNQVCNYSPWYSYGRWILLGVLIFVALLVFFLFSCISARRRRSAGYRPYTGTAWTLGQTPAGHGTAQYTGRPQYEQPVYGNNGAAPPAYQAPSGGYYNRDVELQQPATAYKPPQGPPPGRV